MLYPDDSQIADFESAYNKAKTISSIGEQSLQVDADPYLGQIKGYDEYRAFNIIKSEEGIPNWNTNYGGHATTRFDYNCMVSEEMRHRGGKSKVEIPAKI